jgi:hypothetical protein
MLRICHFVALLSLYVMLAAPARAQKGPLANSRQSTKLGAQAALPSARVEHVLVRGTGAAMEVEIQTSGAQTAPDTEAITDPDRIVVDFPGALPAAELRALEVNRGALKRVRSGLFFRNPPITRVVLDLSEPQSYRIATTPNAIVVKLGPINVGPVDVGSINVGASNAKQENLPANAEARIANASNASVPNVLAPNISAPSVVAHSANISKVSVANASVQNRAVAPSTPAKIQNASLASGTSFAANAKVASVKASDAVPTHNSANLLLPVVDDARPQLPVTVTYANGMLRIHAAKATLSQVLFEVQQQTKAEIAIPAGAEREEVVTDLGPAPAREVLAALLNGSHYNFIFVGNETTLERVILTQRDPQ